MIDTTFNASAEGKGGFAAQDLLAKFASVSDGFTPKIGLNATHDAHNDL